jgi:uncharacterized protein with GYD domain
MATYIVLANFTEQGLRNVKDTLKRAEAFKQGAKKFGVSVKELYWTLGRHDVVAIVDGADDTTITALTLGLNSGGNVRTQTLRALGVEDMKKVLDTLSSHE